MNAVDRDPHGHDGPGQPENEPHVLPGPDRGAPGAVLDPRGVYPSEPPGALGALTPVLHGNGFWNSGALESLDTTPMPPSNAVTSPRRHVPVLLHDPPVHARDGHRDVRRRPPCRSSRRGRRGNRRGARPSGADARVLGRRRAGDVEHDPQPVRRHHRDALRPGPDGDADGRLPPLHRALGHAAAEHARVRQPEPDPRAAAPRARRRPDLVHFKNLDFALRHPHSMHFHGVRYKPSSDGAYVPGVSGRDGDVMPGQSWTYRLTALPTSVGVWPYHDHSPSMHDSIMGGMYGMLSIIGRNEAAPGPRVRRRLHGDGRLPDDRRARVRRQHPGLPSRVGDLVQWDVMGMGSEHHSFHVHGHRWLRPAASRATPRPSARPSRSACAGARRIRAPGSTTATSRSTWPRG